MALTQEQFNLLRNRLQQAKSTLPPADYNKIAEAVAQSVEQPGFLKRVYQGVTSPVLNMIARPGQAVQSALGQEPSTGRFAGVNINAPKTGADLKKDVGRSIETAAFAIPAGKLSGLAASGGAFGLGSSLEEGNPLLSKDTTISTLLGVGTAMATGLATKAIGKGISKVAEKTRESVTKPLSKALGYTSDVPSDVIESAITNPSQISQAQKSVYTEKGSQNLLSTLQQGTRDLRKNLTTLYQTGQQQIADSFNGVRAGLPDKEASLFSKISDRFSVDLPQDIKNMSASEILDLNAELNSLYNKKMIRESADGVIVRKGKDALNTLIDRTFTTDVNGVKSNAVKDFLKEYSSQKTVFDNMNSIFNAYKDKDAKAISQAYRNLEGVFREDRYAYISAINDFAKATGVDVMNELKALQLKNFMNKSGKFSGDELFRIALSPLTSPRLVGLEAKTLGRLINSAQSFGEFISNLSGLVEKGQRANIFSTNKNK